MRQPINGAAEAEGIFSMEQTVSIVACGGYGEEESARALREVLEPLDGLSCVRAGMRGGIKVNLVSALRPEAAATTHPALLSALVRLLRERGAEVVVGDSPGGVFTLPYLHKVYRTTGMDAVAAAGAVLNENVEVREATFPEAYAAHTFRYTAWLDDCDLLINFCKLKTHGMMGMSCAAKNLFGCVPGTTKPEYHFRFPEPERFSDMILDLNRYFRPALCIVDAVVGMEGNGPTAGTPRPIGALLASADPHALDLVCASLIGLAPEDVPTLAAARRHGLIPATAAEVRVCGDPAAFALSDYQIVTVRRSMLFAGRGGAFGRMFSVTAGRLLRSRPHPQRSCIGCGKCRDICPAHAIEIKGGRAKIHRKNCIRCFCCQEFCPIGAMTVQRTLVARMLSK